MLAVNPKSVTSFHLDGAEVAGGAKSFVPLEKGGLGGTTVRGSVPGIPEKLTAGEAQARSSLYSMGLGAEKYPFYIPENSRPRYGTRYKPVQDIASIYSRKIYDEGGSLDRKFITRNVSVQRIAYNRADLSQVHSTLPRNVFVQFRGEAPLSVSFSCILLNTNDFDWEREWSDMRESGTLNSRILATEGRLLEVWVDGVIYCGYILGDDVTKSIEMEAAPSMNFQFLALSRVTGGACITDDGVLSRQKSATSSYYVDADFRTFMTRRLTSAQKQGIPKEFAAWWRDYYGWIQDPDDLKKLQKESFLSKFFKGALDYLNDPQKAMILAQAVISGDTSALKTIGIDLAAGATEAGLLAGVQGTKMAPMVSAMLENGMGKTLVAQMFQGNWAGGLRTFTGMSSSTLRASPLSKPLKSWGGASIGLGSWAQRKYFGTSVSGGGKKAAWG